MWVPKKKIASPAKRPSANIDQCWTSFNFSISKSQCVVVHRTCDETGVQNYQPSRQIIILSHRA